MPRVERCPTCGGDVTKPDPPGRTQEEKIAFRQEWDRRYEEGQKREADKRAGGGRPAGNA